MGSPRLRAGQINRKHKLLAVLALFLVFTTIVPFFASAASPSPTPTPSSGGATPIPPPGQVPAQPGGKTPTPTTPPPAAPTEPVTEITIYKESDSKWLIYYPDNTKVAFETVATYRLENADEVGEVEDWKPVIGIYDNRGNKLPVDAEEATKYMESKGLWQERKEKVEEQGFWNKVLNFLKGIWSGVKEISESVYYFFNALVTGNLGSLILYSVLKLIGEGVTDVIINTISVADSTEALFELPVARVFISFSENVGFMFWIIGFIIALGELVINQKTNMMSNSIQNFIMNIFKSGVALVLFLKVPVPLYSLISKIALKISEIILNVGLSYEIDFESLRWTETPSDILLVIFFLALLFSGIKVLFSFVKRSGVLMILLLIGSVHMISTPRGYWDAFWSWCRQLIALCITNFCQIALLCAGVSVFFSSFMVSLSQFLAGLSLVLASAEVPRIADRFGIDTSIRGNAMGAVSTIATTTRILVSK